MTREPKRKGIPFFKKPNISGKLPFIACGIILAVVLVVIVSRHFLGNSPRELYFKAESRNFNRYFQQLKSYYRDFYTAEEPYLTEKYKRRTEIAVEASSAGKNPADGGRMEQILDAVGRSKIILDTRHDPAEEKSLAKASLLFEKSPLVDAEIFVNGKELGFGVPLIMPERYFLINIDKLENVYDRFGIPVKPKRILKKTDFAKTIYFRDEEVDRAAKKYGSLISGFIEENDVKFGNNVNIMVGNEDKTGREVFVTLDKNKTEKLFSRLLATAAEDEELLRLTYGNLSGVSGLFKESGFLTLFNDLKDKGILALNENILELFKNLDIKNDIESFKNALRNAADNTEFPEGFEMKLVIDRHGNILDRELRTAIMDANTRQMYEIDLHSGCNDLKNAGLKNVFCTVSIASTGPEEGKLQHVFSISTKLIPLDKNGSEEGKIEVSYGKSRNEAVEFATNAQFNIKRSTDNATLKRNVNVAYDITIQGGSQSQKDRFYGELSSAAGKNSKLKTVNFNTVLNVKADLPTMGITDTAVRINLATEDKFGIGEFTLPEPDNMASVRLDDISESQLARLKKDVEASFGMFYINNKDLFDSFLR